ncbi:hypothetical protein JTE88_03825 [Arcanobacterium phocisimile]|uniref:DUF2530 domain-containing protein n=1 Tax=Arcanobacterium phocisimile TaxID=1302235 RepID=A0ABX7IIB0_9ACTO|nr:hypothetical protein [Arcanobacterium phocisimile]QRV02861.1 hypothetical protein JTE88_03825 [Arcanobacterium phocisimile]
MAREDNDLGNLSNWDADAEWENIISLDPTQRYAGPRDWHPTDDDGEFHPHDLPPALPVAQGTFPRIAFALWATCGLFVALFLAGFYDVIALGEGMWLLTATAAFACAVGAIILHSPRENDFDDDGARL